MPGIGTGGETDWNPLHLYNLAVGRGIEEKIMEGYSFICHNYTTPQDEIILIGFSRGGFIIRCIADLIHRVGVLTKFGLYYLRDVYDMWRDAGENRGQPIEPPYHGSEAYSTSQAPLEDSWPMLGDPVCSDLADSVFEFDLSDDEVNLDHPTPTTPATPTASEKIETRLSRDELRESINNCNQKIVRRGVRIEVCAAWDTVGALGPISPRLGLFRPRQFRKLGFIRSNLNPSIINAFQALSLHDRRRSFLPIVWTRPSQDDADESHSTEDAKTSRLEQCWFMGDHGDVGGGKRGDGLAQFPLAWMLGKLRRFVDMNADNFWSPRLNCSNWRLVENGGKKAGLRYQLKNTFTPIFWLGGADCRKPRRQFWTNSGFEVLKGDRLKANDDVSGEFMHFTVQLLIQDNAMKRSKCLRRADVPVRAQDSEVVWQLPVVTRYDWQRLVHMVKKLMKRGSTSSDVYQVSEVPMTRKHGCRYPELAVELILLMKWWDSELDVLHSNATEKDPMIGMLIAQTKARLGNFLEDIKEDLNRDMGREAFTADEMRSLIEHELQSF